MKEVDVREKIEGMLPRLGYRKCHIQREFPVEIQAGCGDIKKHFADFVISVNRKRRIVIEAKASTKNISNKKIIGQARSYAMNLEISFFAICNGKDFALYKTKGTQCILKCKMRELSQIKEKICCSEFEPKRRKTFTENLIDGVIEGDLSKTKDQVANIVKKKTKTFLEKLIQYLDNG